MKTRRVPKAWVAALCIAAARTSALPAQTASADPVGIGVSEVVIRPGDLLRVAVWPDETLGGEFLVEESGFVYLPFLGRVMAAGASLATLREDLSRGYGEVRKNPVVTITPLFNVGVTGEVQRPGIYPVAPTNTLFDALAMAGGFGPRANARRVRIVRGMEVVHLDAIQALETGVRLDNLRLQSGDQVVVPRKSGFGFGSVVAVLNTLALAALVVDRLSE